MSCIGCSFEHYPCCAIQSIISAVDIDAIFDDKPHKEIKYPVCHKNAHSVNENKIVKNGSCDNCMLCEIVCPFLDIPNVVSLDTEHIALNDLNRLNILLKSLLPETIVATEAKVKGNAREKRVDLVVKKDKYIFFIKVLSDIDRYSFYSRSYEDIKNHYALKYIEYTIYNYTLISSQKIELARSKSYECKTINEIIQKIQEI
ncbi:MAG: hypothetical protein J6B48_09505 [Clostridia bacterium]|nr:hypothetical protein [Clostridia bacterium]